MILSTFAILGGASGFHASAAESNATEQTIIRNEEQVSIQGTDKIFTGNARIDRIYPANNKMRSNGTSITFEPGARTHWHGAAANKSMTHIEINEAEEPGKVVEWMEPVSDEQYEK